MSSVVRGIRVSAPDFVPPSWALPSWGDLASSVALSWVQALRREDRGRWILVVGFGREFDRRRLQVSRRRGVALEHWAIEGRR